MYQTMEVNMRYILLVVAMFIVSACGGIKIEDITPGEYCNCKCCQIMHYDFYWNPENKDDVCIVTPGC